MMSDDSLDWEALKADVEGNFSHDQRLYISILMHDYVSNPVLALAMQVEIVKKMAERGMDFSDELADLQQRVSNVGNTIKEIERIIQPPRDDD